MRLYLPVLIIMAVIFLPVVAYPLDALAQAKGLNTVEEGLLFLQDKLVSRSGLPEDGGSVVTRVINFMLGLAAVLTLIALIIGGVMYILSFGSEERAKKAKNIIIYAIVGLIVIMLSFFLLFLVRAILAPPPAP